LQLDQRFPADKTDMFLASTVLSSLCSLMNFLFASILRIYSLWLRFMYILRYCVYPLFLLIASVASMDATPLSLCSQMAACAQCHNS
jgi:hypothetical protein